MIYKSYTPAKPLRSYIAHYWTMESQGHDKKGDVFRFIPDGYVDWVFHFDSEWKHKMANSPEFCDTSRFHVFGQLKSYMELVQTTKWIKAFGIKFNPVFASCFFQDDMSNHTNSCHDILDLDIPMMDSYIDKLLLAKTIDDKIKSTDDYLQNLLKYSGSMEDLHHVFSSTNASIGQRRLEQYYRSKIGISPKLFQRINRFNAIVDSLIFEKNPNLTKFTYKHGFFDQSHLIKAFKKFTGHAPTSFLKKINPCDELYNLKA